MASDCKHISTGDHSILFPGRIYRSNFITPKKIMQWNAIVFSHLLTFLHFFSLKFLLLALIITFYIQYPYCLMLIHGGSSLSVFSCSPKTEQSQKGQEWPDRCGGGGGSFCRYFFCWYVAATHHLWPFASVWSNNDLYRTLFMAPAS